MGGQVDFFIYLSPGQLKIIWEFLALFDHVSHPHHCLLGCFRIFHTVILDDPFDDPDGLEIPDKSPGPTQEMLEVLIFLTVMSILIHVYCPLAFSRTQVSYQICQLKTRRLLVLYCMTAMMNIMETFVVISNITDKKTLGA